MSVPPQALSFGLLNIGEVNTYCLDFRDLSRIYRIPNANLKIVICIQRQSSQGGILAHIFLLQHDRGVSALRVGIAARCISLYVLDRIGPSHVHGVASAPESQRADERMNKAVLD